LIDEILKPTIDRLGGGIGNVKIWVSRARS
jgi:hypothetical protein